MDNSQSGPGSGTDAGIPPEHRDGAGASIETEYTPEEVRELEPKNASGGYNVLGADGRRVKRFSREYFAALGIDPPGWAEVLPEEEGIEGEVPAPKVKVKPEKVSHPGTYQAPRSARERRDQAEHTAAVLLTILNGIVEPTLGPGATMQPEERAAIEGPLARIMERMSPVTNALLEKWSDPILLIFAVGTWAGRVYLDFQLQNGGDDEGGGFDNSAPPLQPGPGSNGRQVDDISASATEVIQAIMPNLVVIENEAV